jgi:ribosome assembly protein 4
LNFLESNAKELALKRFSAVYSPGEERLVSASDDFTLFMWLPEKEKKPAGIKNAVN